MITSESVVNIFPALIAAQGEMAKVWKSETNPHFKSKYADLPAIQDMANPVLAKHGLAVIQSPGASLMLSDNILALSLTTRIIHGSGEWVEETLQLPLTKADPQGAGSAITYGRRYALAAMLNITVDQDDDGNAGSGHRAQPAAAPAQKPDPTRWQPPAKPSPATAPQSASNAPPASVPGPEGETQAQRAIREHREKQAGKAMAAAPKTGWNPGMPKPQPTADPEMAKAKRSWDVDDTDRPYCVQHAKLCNSKDKQDDAGADYVWFWCTAKNGDKYCDTSTTSHKVFERIAELNATR